VLAGLVSTIGCVLYLAIEAIFKPASSANPHVRRYVRSIVIFYLVSYMLWLRMFSIYRYVMPLEALSPLMLAVLFFGLRTKAGNSPYNAIFGCLFFIMSIATIGTTKYPNWMRAPYSSTVLGAQTALDSTGATVIGAAGDPPISYLFAVMPNAAHFITIASRDTIGARLFEKATSVVAHSNKIYVLYQENGSSQILVDVERYWGLTRSPVPCISVEANIGSSFIACRFLHGTPRQLSLGP